MAVLTWAVSPSDFDAGPIGIQQAGSYKTLYTTIATGFTSAQKGRLNIAANSDIWLSCYLRASAIDSDGHEMIVFYNGDAPLIKIGRVTGTSHDLAVYTYNGTSYTEALPTGVINMGQVDEARRIDVHIKLDDAAGEIKVYQAGILKGTFSGDTITNGALNTIDNIRFSGNDVSSPLYYAAIIIADEDTRGMNLSQTTISGAGNYQQQASGAYTDIDSLGVDDAAAMTLENSGDKATFTKGASNAVFASGYSVVGVGVSGRVKKNGASPTGHKMMVRSGTTDSNGTTQATQEAYQCHKELFTTNPATGSAWTKSEADAAEVGIEVS